MSNYNKNYYCIIEKVEFLSGIIRIFIDERGDGSLGDLQHPMSSRLGIVSDNDSLSESKNPIDGKFLINDESRQYAGYLDFAVDNSLLSREYVIGFQYGQCGYSTAKLFRFNQELIDKYYVKSP